MKNLKLLFAFATASAVIACSKEIAETPASAVDEPTVGVFSAFFEDGTKVTMDGAYALSWEAGDAVSIFKAGDSVNAKYTADAAGASTSLSGAAIDAAANYFAVYPYSEANVFDGTSKITATLPASQTAVAGQVPVYLSVASAPGAAPSLSFKNVGALVEFKIATGDNVARVSISGNNNEDIAGKVEIDASAATPSYTVAEGSKVVVIAPESGNFAAGTYYASVLPQSFSAGISVKLFDKTGRQVTLKQTVAQTVARSTRLPLGIIDNLGTFSVNRTITDAAEFVNFVSNVDSETWTIANDIDLAGVEIPSAASFAGTLDGASHTLTNLRLTNSLFQSLSGTVKDLTIGAGSKLELPQADADPRTDLNQDVVIAGSFGFIAGTNAGTISGCTNAGTVHTGLVFALNGSDDVMSVGGIAGTNTTGTIEDCTNDGAFTLEPAGIRKGMACYFGGVVGNNEGTLSGTNQNTGAVIFDGATSSVVYMGGVAGYIKTGATAGTCTNSGSITSENSGSSQKINGYLGGVAGWSSVALTGCTNSGALNVKSTFTITYVGGVTGYSAGLTSCKNTGAIDYDFVNTSAVNTQSQQAHIGGVTGRNVTTKLSKCNLGTSNGGITVNNGFAYTDPSYIGGVAGSSTQIIEGNTGANSIASSRCTNSTPITINGNIYAYVGGVVGQQASMTLSWVANGGNITFANPADNSKIGGIAGYRAGANMQMSQSNGNINVTAGDGVTGVAVGGFFGSIGANQTIHSSLVKSQITTTNATAGLAVGDGGTYTLTLGSTADASYNVPGLSEKVRYFIVKPVCSVNGDAVTEATLTTYTKYAGAGNVTLTNMKWID